MRDDKMTAPIHVPEPVKAAPVPKPSDGKTGVRVRITSGLLSRPSSG